ncbi:MAG TPA: beta-ketoacyl-ACP synthase II, partial [Acidimicrobiales bacterium]|nr:beta-ketoacyl-ACP synthase II [Acidimicrobiales bacterium]
TGSGRTTTAGSQGKMVGMQFERRVVVTGTGAVTPLGTDVQQTWAGMVGGRSAVGPIRSFEASNLPVRIAAEVRDFTPGDHFGVRDARRVDRFAQLGIVAARQALAQSGLDVAARPDRVGVVFGSGLGGLTTLVDEVAVLADRGPTRVSPFLVPMMIPNMAAGQIAIESGATGPSSCPVTACAASATAIGEAVDLIRLGRADAVIAGGADATVAPICVAAFAQMKALSSRNDDPQAASRPFDADRDGFVLGEGGAALVLEELEHARARKATVLAEVAGWGSSSDAHHLTAPEPRGAGAAAAMRAALADARLPSEAVGYLNAHGTSTQLNDHTEALAIREVVGTTVAVSSTKGVTGHLLGAAGAAEAIACVQVLATGLVPPTANLHRPDPDCGLDLVTGEGREEKVDVTMSNSFGFGGHNVTLMLRRA